MKVELYAFLCSVGVSRDRQKSVVQIVKDMIQHPATHRKGSSLLGERDVRMKTLCAADPKIRARSTFLVSLEQVALIVAVLHHDVPAGHFFTILKMWPSCGGAF